MLSNLYCGSSSYVTQCRKCGQQSQHSSNVSDFFELDLQARFWPLLWLCSTKSTQLTADIVAHGLVSRCLVLTRAVCRFTVFPQAHCE